jgi:pimeloyl-ACP methyl ester carboxylesterase
MGHSMGGKLAMTLTLHHPSVVEKLIVVDMGIRRCMPQYEMQTVIDTMCQIYPEQYQNRTALIKELSCPKRLKDLIIKNIRHGKPLSWKPNIVAIVANIDKLCKTIGGQSPFIGKTLFLRSEHSDYLSLNDFVDIRTLFPNASLITVPNSGHWIHADNPKMLVSLMMNDEES